MNFFTAYLATYSSIFHQHCPNSNSRVCTTSYLREGNPELCQINSLLYCSGAASRQLDPKLCEIASPYADGRLSFSNLYKSADGNTNGAYILPNAVLKEIHWAPNLRRKIEQSTYAREICEKNNYQHLIIPKSCITEGTPENYDFAPQVSAEEKLPISTRENNWLLYEQNTEAFTEASKELTGFLMQVKTSDLIGSKWGMQPRYDNIGTYLEDTESGPIGKLGLIDLDHLSLSEPPHTSLEACQIAIAFFPYHFEDILEAAKKFDPQIERHLPELETMKNNALENHVRVHWKCMADNQITHENVHMVKSITYTPERIEKLKARIQKKLESHELTVPFPDFYRIGSEYSLLPPGTCTHFVNPQHVLPALFGEDQALVSKLESIGKTQEESIISRVRNPNIGRRIPLDSDSSSEELEKNSEAAKNKRMAEVANMTIPELATLRLSYIYMDERFAAKNYATGESLGYHREGPQHDIACLLEDIDPCYDEATRQEIARVILVEAFTEWEEEGDILKFSYDPSFGYLFNR